MRHSHGRESPLLLLTPRAMLRLVAVKQVFPTFDFLGWYSVGQEPSPRDTALHQQVRNPVTQIGDARELTPGSRISSSSTTNRPFSYNSHPPRRTRLRQQEQENRRERKKRKPSLSRSTSRSSNSSPAKRNRRLSPSRTRS